MSKRNGNEKVGSKWVVNDCYNQRIKDTLDNALSEHSRIIAIRCDLLFPREGLGRENSHAPLLRLRTDTKVISRFFASLTKQIESTYKRTVKYNSRAYKTSVRYIWVREKLSSENWHYHTCIILNGNSFRGLGNYKSESKTLNSMIKKAWARAIGIDVSIARSLARIPKNPVYYLNKNHEPPLFEEEYKELINRLDYLAKKHTKYTADGGRSFGCSLK